ncbi:MAG: glutaredoxin 3 [Leptolyngbya sp. SIO4C1]|nr:glutaredoxin 3 [Leptolyngbya sp. SIO4C1]
MSLFTQLFNRSPKAAKVEIYTWQLCPYCIRAKLLLWWKGASFTEYKIDGDAAARSQMAARANGRRSVPQIFIDDRHIGGCDDLYALDRANQLEPLLGRSAQA